MDKTALETRLKALEEEAASLRVQIAALPPALLARPNPSAGERYWSVATSIRPGAPLCASYLASPIAECYLSANMFFEEKTAQRYAEAIETLLTLRQQPGTVTADSDGQWVIEVGSAGNPSGEVRAAFLTHIGSKRSRISPSFSKETHAVAAIREVGERRIEAMFRTFGHYS